jgi:hypothetical protein
VVTGRQEDGDGRHLRQQRGEEFFQPAEMVILSALRPRTRLLLLSGIGKSNDLFRPVRASGKNYAVIVTMRRR